MAMLIGPSYMSCQTDLQLLQTTNQKAVSMKKNILLSLFAIVALSASSNAFAGGYECRCQTLILGGPYSEPTRTHGYFFTRYRMDRARVKYECRERGIIPEYYYQRDALIITDCEKL